MNFLETLNLLCPRTEPGRRVTVHSYTTNAVKATLADGVAGAAPPTSYPSTPMYTSMPSPNSYSMATPGVAGGVQPSPALVGGGGGSMVQGGRMQPPRKIFRRLKKFVSYSERKGLTIVWLRGTVVLVSRLPGFLVACV